jgi:hypothetical protein
MATSRKVIGIFSIAAIVAISALTLTSGVASAEVIDVPDEYTTIHDAWANAQLAHAPPGPWSSDGVMVTPFSDRWEVNFQIDDFMANFRSMRAARKPTMSNALWQQEQPRISLSSRAPVGNSGVVYNVPGDYPTIQQAIDNATGGETILVEPGRYNETVDVTVSNIVIKANSTNPADTIVSANGTDDHVINITNQTNVTIKGFTIQDARGTSQDVAGIYMNTTSDCTISNTVIMNISTAGSYDAYGVLVETAINLTSTDTTVRDIHGNNNSIGILIEEGMNIDFDPTLTENVTASNGTAFGLLIEAINLRFTDTAVHNITGNSFAYGILLFTENVSFNHTVIERVNASYGPAYGIFAEICITNGSFTDTTIRDIAGNITACGIYMDAENVSFDTTVIERVTQSRPVYGGAVGIATVITNGSFTDTTIRDITGNNIAHGIYMITNGSSFTDTTIRDITGRAAWGVGVLIQNSSFTDTTIHNITGDSDEYDAIGVFIIHMINGSFTDTTISDIQGNDFAIGIFGHMNFINSSFFDTTIRDINGNESAIGFAILSGLHGVAAAVNVTFDYTVIERVSARSATAAGFYSSITDGSFTDTTIRDIAGNSSAFGVLIEDAENVTFDPTVIERVTASNGEAGGIVGVIQNSSFTDTTIRDIAGNSSTPGYLVKCHVAAITGFAINNTNFSGGEITNCGHGIWLGYGQGNRIEGFIISDNTLFDTGVHLETSTSNTTVCRNCFYNNVLQAWDNGTNNSWDGNFWSDWNGTGSYPINGSAGSRDSSSLDECPLKEAPNFDTGGGTYPSIAGTHNGTLTPSCNLKVSKFYTYPCLGTGGHTESVKIWDSTGWNVTATWDGYAGDWHNLSFNKSFTLYANETYYYTIQTGSYPQIIHAESKDATGGVITCTEFMDINGKRYKDWIPAIRLS